MPHVDAGCGLQLSGAGFGIFAATFTFGGFVGGFLGAGHGW